MATVLIRDLDDQGGGEGHGRSLHAEIRNVLQRAATRDLAATRRVSTQWLQRLRRSPHSESAALLRDDRDQR